MSYSDVTTSMGEFATVFFEANLKFYDKNPIVASTGYLLFMGTFPLIALLRFASRMKELDNDVVKARIEAQVRVRTQAKRQVKTSPQSVKS
ncbi:hypothetical protein [Photobacterium profundum]|uniref:hypothetical protein n=1 Tax=Photobacterium profundum TaxID=74109 RepID=UPI003D102399